jgi:hypothetical protein
MVLDAFTVGGVVTRGRIQVLDRDAYQLALDELPEGLCVDITIAADTHEPPRVQQRRYWHGVIVPLLAKRFRTTPRQMSRDLLAAHFGLERGAFDQPVPFKPSLSWLTVEDMSNLIDWAIEQGRATWKVEIPPPR